MRQELHHRANFNVWIPRGHQGYWELIRKHHAEFGEFSVRDIDDNSNVDSARIRHYVRLLTKAGLIKIVRREARGGARVPIYKLVKDQKQTPRIRKDGSLIVTTHQEQLWTAIRNLKQFGVDELVFVARTDSAISKSYALRYLRRLTEVGYLSVVQKQAGRHRKQVWRLKPSKDTGPLPPVRLGVEVMWDQNLRAEMGDAIAEERSL